MGASKTGTYTNKQLRMAAIAKALAHPARIAIIDFIIKEQSCICNDIVNMLPLAQPTISQHLRELKQAGLIKGTIDGNAICYCINEKVWQELLNYTSKIAQQLQSKNHNYC